MWVLLDIILLAVGVSLLLTFMVVTHDILFALLLAQNMKTFTVRAFPFLHFQLCVRYVVAISFFG
jgi:hypothetical protein